MTDQPYGRQIPLDGQGGAIGDNPQDDIAHLREGGQTNYEGIYKQGREPFDRVALTTKPDFETRFVDLDVQPVPVAVQEDRALLVYDFVQKQYNVQLTGGATTLAGTEIDVVEDGWWWMPDRVSMFGTATGFLTLSDGNASDNTQVFATQAGVAALLGGVQTVQGLIMSQRTPLILRAIGVDANAPIQVGLWYRKCKWVWTPAKIIQDAPGYSDEGQIASKLPGLQSHNEQSRSLR
jgi:hypothetical protein